MERPVNPPWNSGTACNVAGALSWQAQRQPHAPAIHYPVRTLTGRLRYASCSYQELDELSSAFARGLHAYGIAPGTRTALMLRPGLEFVAMFFALFKAGAVPVLIDPGIGLQYLRQCLDEAAPAAFVGVTKAQIARKLFGWARASCQRFVTAGPVLGLGGISLARLRRLGGDGRDSVVHASAPDDMAAILFTSGSTGTPKGVIYRHRHFAAQVEMLQRAFGIQPGEVGLSSFPPFALFDPALGMTTVVPPLDPTQPAAADPARLREVLDRFRVTSLFASPAVLDLLGRHMQAQNARFLHLKRVISAGAAVSIPVMRRMEQALAQDAVIHAAYGATECLPISSVSHRELDHRVAELSESGAGICVGKVIAPNQLRVIRLSESPLASLADAVPLPPGVPGEIIVTGPSCTDAYWAREEETALAKLRDEFGSTWHRTGDVGALDGQGCLWFCGRVSQRVATGPEVLFPEQVEGIFNQHPDAARTALVGVGPPGRQLPVLCVETAGRLSKANRERLHYDLLQLAQAHVLTRSVRTVLFHPGFPVDIRHNSKIRREQLAQWATREMQKT